MRLVLAKNDDSFWLEITAGAAAVAAAAHGICLLANGCRAGWPSGSATKPRLSEWARRCKRFPARRPQTEAACRDSKSRSEHRGDSWRYLRDQNHFAKALAYIEQNPVKAGLAKEAGEWKFSSAGKKEINSPAGMPALPGTSAATGTWKGAAGLAADIRYYGQWMRDEAEKRIGHLYPKVKLPKEHGGGEATVIAWLWARTVASPNPAAKGAHVPLVRSFWLSTKAGKKAWVKPVVDQGTMSYRFEVRTGNGVGAAMEALNGLGHGLHEKPYENALAVEFGLQGISFVQQPRFDLVYKTVNVGEYVPDLIAFSAVVVEAKVIEAITDQERGQMLNYLRITGHKVGVILNFKRAKLEWERIVLDKNR